jgi:hypothetical protein
MRLSYIFSAIFYMEALNMEQNNENKRGIFFWIIGFLIYSIVVFIFKYTMGLGGFVGHGLAGLIGFGIAGLITK